MTRRVKAKVPTFNAAKYRAGKIPRLDEVAKYLLYQADKLFELSGDLDTAVRDVMAEGIARLVHAAYDSQACSLGLQGPAFSAFIETSTAEWFRERGFAEWFCLGAGALFSTSRPRTLAEMRSLIRIRRSPGRKPRKKGVAA